MRHTSYRTLLIKPGCCWLCWAHRLGRQPVRWPAAKPRRRPGRPSPMHPAFAVLDANGDNVLSSGAAVSLGQTCGACHDTAFIAQHSFHADLGLSSMVAAGQTSSGAPWDTSTGLFGKWDPLTYRYLTTEGVERLDLSTAEWLQVRGRAVSGGGPGCHRAQRPAAVGGRPDPARGQHPGSATGQAVAVGLGPVGRDGNELFAVPHPQSQQRGAHRQRLRAGRFGDAVTATLLGAGLVRRTATVIAGTAEAFGADGELKAGVLAIQDPTNENCAQCHGVVHTDLATRR
jgi:cytochrome c553